MESMFRYIKSERKTKFEVDSAFWSELMKKNEVAITNFGETRAQFWGGRDQGFSLGHSKTESSIIFQTGHAGNGHMRLEYRKDVWTNKFKI